jgi:hypothetical protein
MNWFTGMLPSVAKGYSLVELNEFLSSTGGTLLYSMEETERLIRESVYDPYSIIDFSFEEKELGQYDITFRFLREDSRGKDVMIKNISAPD